MAIRTVESRIRDCLLWCRFQTLKKVLRGIKMRSPGSPLLNLELGIPAIKSYGTRITMRGIGKPRLRLLNTIEPLASTILPENYREQYLHEFCDRSNSNYRVSKQRISRRCYILRWSSVITARCLLRWWSHLLSSLGTVNRLGKPLKGERSVSRYKELLK